MSVRTRLFLSLTLVVVAGLGLAGCAVPASSISTSPTPTPSGISAHTCAPGSSNAATLKIGAILPMSGPSYLGGYAQMAAITKAVDDIMKAGGISVATKTNPTASSLPACVISYDSGAGLDAAAAATVGAQFATQGLSVILTALSTEATAAVTVANPGTPVLSLTSTAPIVAADFFRIGPPSWAEAQALTQTLIVDGNPKIAMVGPTDASSMAMRASIQSEFAEQKGLVLYGGIEPTPSSAPAPAPSATALTVSDQISAAILAKPDAIVIVAAGETPEYLRELIKQKWKMPKVYLIKTNVIDYSKVFATGDLLAVQGTIPGQSPSEELRRYLNDWSQATRNTNIESVNYAAEAYDATVLAALGAVNYAHTQPSYISSSLLAVSGTYGGDLCYSFTDCAKMLTENRPIHYKGVSSMGPFTGTREISTSMISIYQYKNDNTPVWTGLVSVRSVKEPKNTP